MTRIGASHGLSHYLCHTVRRLFSQVRVLSHIATHVLANQLLHVDLISLSVLYREKCEKCAIGVFTWCYAENGKCKSPVRSSENRESMMRTPLLEGHDPKPVTTRELFSELAKVAPHLDTGGHLASWSHSCPQYPTAPSSSTMEGSSPNPKEVSPW